MPYLSVLMPVYNASAFLAEAIDSIVRQTFQDFELILIDDGSTDGSRDIMGRFASKDSRIRVMFGEHGGAAAARNKGLSVAKGAYIALMDSDDVAMLDRFAAQVSYLDNNPEVVAVGGHMILIDAAGRRLMTFKVPLNHEEIDRHLMRGAGLAAAQGAATVRASALREVGGYDEQFKAAEDFDLWLRLAEVGRLANLDQQVLLYRQHIASDGYANHERQRFWAWKASKAAAERRGVTFNVPSPAGEPAVPVDAVHRKWGWWALQAGNLGPARYYAWKALRAAPTDLEAWRLAACALRGR